MKYKLLFNEVFSSRRAFAEQDLLVNILNRTAVFLRDAMNYSEPDGSDSTLNQETEVLISA
jgi:hypothetical protein